MRAGLTCNMASSQRPKQPRLTHFLCLPLVTPSSRPQLSASITAFKADVTRSTSLGGFALPPDAVRPIGSLHLTLGVMSLLGNEELDKAVGILKSLKPRDILAAVKAPTMPGSSNQTPSPGEVAPSEILISLKGLKAMQKPERATVLYAPPMDPDGRLQGYAETISAKFKDAGLLVPDDRPLLLHASIVNTIYVKRDKRMGKKGGRMLVEDAQSMLYRYEDRVWMEHVPLEKIAICEMGAKPVEENGVVVDAEYEVVADIDF